MPKPGKVPLSRTVEAVSEIDRVLHLSIRGIAQLSKSARIVEALEPYEQELSKEYDSAEYKRKVDSARLEADLAKRELDRGFPLLHAYATVSLWGILEAAIEDVVLDFLDVDSTCFEHPALAVIKILLAEFEQLEKPDRLRFLLAEYIRNSKADLKLGVSRFEVVLELARLSGPVADDLRRNLFEHQQIRNVLVHRAGIADRRLLAQCPWLDVKVGEAVEISHQQYIQYRDAILAYLHELVMRFFLREGLTREQAEAKIRS